MDWNRCEKFNYHFYHHLSKTIEYNVPIPLPSDVTIQDIANNISSTHEVPNSLRNDLFIKLREFILERTQLFEDLWDQEEFFKTDYLQKRSECLLVFDKLIKSKLKIQTPVEDEDHFHEMYHKLIHSGFLTEPLVALEHSHVVAIQEMVNAKEADLEKLSEKQTVETEKLLKLIGQGITDEDVNRLSLKYFKETELLADEWDTKITDLNTHQKKEFRHWIEQVYEGYCKREEDDYLIRKVRNQTKSSLHHWEEIVEKNQMQESFTINLGSQLKSSHNLLLKSASILSLCDTSYSSRPTPQRIHTAMSLYSDSLTGIILLVDDRINSYTGIKKAFAKLCPGDLHFPDLAQQLSQIRSHLSTPCPGDVYITRHSTLSVHIVFHLICPPHEEITSRSDVMMGLKNIMRVAYSEVGILSIPLLLIHEMNEEITMGWCMKRAELVLKCIKGFMIEMASREPGEELMIQFIVPEDISCELFNSLTGMISEIFRLSNPLILRSDSL